MKPCEHWFSFPCEQLYVVYFFLDMELKMVLVVRIFQPCLTVINVTCCTAAALHIGVDQCRYIFFAQPAVHMHTAKYAPCLQRILQCRRRVCSAHCSACAVSAVHTTEQALYLQ